MPRVVTTPTRSRRSENASKSLPASIERHSDNDSRGFQHSRGERKKIIRGLFQGNQTKSAKSEAKSPHSTIKAVSHKVKAAEPQQPANKTCLLYVGRLAEDTTEESLREHIRETGLNNTDVADVIKLKCKQPGQTSFCVSLNTKKAENSLYALMKWPSGVKVRPYKPARKVHSNALKYKKGRYQQHSRPNKYQHRSEPGTRHLTHRSVYSYHHNDNEDDDGYYYSGYYPKYYYNRWNNVDHSWSQGQYGL